MSGYIRKFFYDDNLEEFRRLLETGLVSAKYIEHPRAGLSKSLDTLESLTSGPHTPVSFRTKNATAFTLSRSDLSARDTTGRTLLHVVSSSNASTALEFLKALLSHPLIDVSIQDSESGYTALHRALYSGNVRAAQALLLRDPDLVKIKDKEGLTAFEVLSSSCDILSERYKKQLQRLRSDGAERVDDDLDSEQPYAFSATDEIFSFGSNKNLNLGFADGDDRQHPERIALPTGPLDGSYGIHDIALEKFRSVPILDLRMSKFHTAIVEDSARNNLYVCGFGSGGRLGLGNENTQLTFQKVVFSQDDHDISKDEFRVESVALGQDHTVAVMTDGSVFTWGSNKHSQLGYAVKTFSKVKDDEPIQLTPRQLLGPLKKEKIVGAAASRIHSVVFTAGAIYVFGRNEGQLGIPDCDPKDLPIVASPRKIGATIITTRISMVSAIDKATAVLMDTHEVFLFTFNIYCKLSWPLERFYNLPMKPFRPSSKNRSRPNYITRIRSGGDTICAISRMGDVFTINVAEHSRSKFLARGNKATMMAQRIWSLRKKHMAVRDADVGQDGSVILCTEAGTVWRRVRRAKLVDVTRSEKSKDYKFSMVQGLTRTFIVRSNAFGAFAALRRDSDSMQTRLHVEKSSLSRDILDMLFFGKLFLPEMEQRDSDTDSQWSHSSGRGKKKNSARYESAMRWYLSGQVQTSLENRTMEWKASGRPGYYDMMISTTAAKGIEVPAHMAVLACRSSVLRGLICDCIRDRSSTLDGVLNLSLLEDSNRNPIITLIFDDIDLLTVVNWVFCLYSDSVLDGWNQRGAFNTPFHRRQSKVKSELLPLSQKLRLKALTRALSSLQAFETTLADDLSFAHLDNDFFACTDLLVLLKDGESLQCHKSIFAQRCPFFDAVCRGAESGRFAVSYTFLSEGLKGRHLNVDMKHVELGTFKIVREHIYTDSLPASLEKLTTACLEDYFDVLLDVLSIANELMLDRLAQMCQQLLGKFVNNRNICHLLNAAGASSETGFKDNGLQYICESLDTMLEQRLLDDLDEDLLEELDQTLQSNQLRSFPHTRSGKLWKYFCDKDPDLVSRSEQNRRTWISGMIARQSRQSPETERRLNKSIPNSYEEGHGLSSSFTRTRRKPSQESKSFLAQSPVLKAQQSAGELIFDMDDEDGLHSVSAKGGARSSALQKRRSSGSVIGSIPRSSSWHDSHGKPIPEESSTIETASSPTSISPSLPPTVIPQSSGQQRPWGASLVMTPMKRDMRDIMEQAGPARKSSLSAGLVSLSVPIQKLSQKEKKRQQQQGGAPASTLDKQPTGPATPVRAPQSASAPSPWAKPATGPIISLKDILSTSPTATSKPSPALGSSPPPFILSSSPLASRRSSLAQNIPSPAINFHGATLQLSMQDIISQQAAAQAFLKGQVEKRSLADIQQEQEFMEWWNKESVKEQSKSMPDVTETEKAAPKFASRGRGKANSGRPASARGGHAEAAGDSSERLTSHTLSQPDVKSDIKRGKGRGRGVGPGEPSARAQGR